MYLSNDFSTGALRLSAPKATLACAAVLALAACGGGSEPSGFAISGQVSGLTAPGLVLSNNGADEVTLASGDSRFVFPTRVAAGAAYDVKVKNQPGGLACSVTQGVGNAQSDVTDVAVACAPLPSLPGGGGGGSGGGSGGAGGGGGTGGPGPGGGTRVGGASECFNRALITPGTTYQWDMQGLVAGKSMAWLDAATLVGGATFEGTSGLVETRRTLTMELDGSPRMVQNIRDYLRLDETAGPVVVTYGIQSEMTLPGGAGTMGVRSVFAPAARHRDFTLGVGESYTYTSTSVNTTTFVGVETTETTTDSHSVAYLGQTQITVPAGTFTACQFRSQFAEGPMDSYVAKGSGLPLVIVGNDGDGNRVRFEMRASSRINGVPVAQYHGGF
ncbi:hypothetical protein [Acidovorax sp.]|uniref:hypothetical protein n=1 Tax=Acidovorax sp. TaxID=1872122 RepID=UPI00261794DC|nr:hypothetical protein [Acidovorax sp.]